MSDNAYQNDLFGPGFREPKKGKIGALRDLSRQLRLPYLRISVESAAVTAIVTIVAVIVAYALGVHVGRSERGQPRDLASDEVISRTGPIGEGFSSIGSEDPVRSGISAGQGPAGVDTGILRVSPGADDTVPDPYEGIRRSAAVADVRVDIPRVTDGIVPVDTGMEYVIHLAAFRNAPRAREMVETLVNEGVEADVVKMGDWYQVCATGFATIEDAREARDKFRKTYSDCFIRRVR